LAGDFLKSENSMIYLDYQATTPLAPEVFDAMLPWLRDNHANPHSVHKLGRAAAAAVEAARDQVAALLPPGGRVIFTSGATEAINMAMGGVAADTITVCATDHAASLDCARRWHGKRPLHIIDVDGDGLIDAGSIAARAGLVTGLLINNEIGVIQPIKQMIAQTHAHGGIFLCDAVQAYGRMQNMPHADMIAISAHKIYGPKGIGALWVRDGLAIEPMVYGGGQEQGLRSGTLSPALCAGFGAAAKLARENMAQDNDHVKALWARAVSLFDGWTINGSADVRYKGNLNIRRDGIDAARLISDCRDIMFSAGSACASGSGRPSHVLRAIGLSDAQAKSSIRLGFGRYTTIDEIDEAAAIINKAAEDML
jgi:cysteine desulfurase